MAKREEPRKTIITLRVGDIEDKEFRLLARAERVSVSEMIRRAVRDRAHRLIAETK